MTDHAQLQRLLDDAVAQAREVEGGALADYIPELANVEPERLSAALTLPGGTNLHAGDALEHRFTLQSSAKLVVLIGLLEERGAQEVFSVVGTEPSGTGFASIARLEQRGPVPANPMVNSGAIALCGQREGSLAERLAWLDRWVERLYGARLPVARAVLDSERRTGDRNRAIAYLLRSTGVLSGDVDEILEAYFTLCSYEANVIEASRLPALLACRGQCDAGFRISETTALTVTRLMATCGMYDESGRHLVRTGFPAKSGVSGVIVAVDEGRCGIAVSSPRINERGGSVRGHAVLGALADGVGKRSVTSRPPG